MEQNSSATIPHPTPIFCFLKNPTPLFPQKRRSVTISGANSPEWFLADLGAVAADSVAVGVYPTNAGEAAVAVARDAETDVVVAEDAEQVCQFIRGGLLCCRSIFFLAMLRGAFQTGSKR